jgi:hypothetical protein
VGAVVGVTKSLSKVNGFHRIDFAGTGVATSTINLNGTGKWVGYYEASNVSSSISRVPDFQVAVTDPTGARVTLQLYGNRSDNKIKKFTYDYNGHKGVAAFQFNASQVGMYKFQIQAVETLPSDADVAIGRDIEKGAVVGGVIIIVGVLFIVAAIVLLIIGFVKRSRHKKELAAPAGYFGGPPPAYGGAPQGYSPPPPGYGGPAPGYGTPPPGYGTPPAYGQPPGPPQDPGSPPQGGWQQT